MFQSSKETVPVGVPLYEENYEYENDQDWLSDPMISFASAAVSISDPYLVEDDDLLDIIAELSDDETHFDCMNELSVVAMPVNPSTIGCSFQNSTVSITVPESCVTAYDSSLCDHLWGDDFSGSMNQASSYPKFVTAEFIDDIKVSFEDKSNLIAAGHCFSKIKHKRKVMKRDKTVIRNIQKNSFESGEIGCSGTAMIISPPSVTAKQIAASSREREGGKFKSNKTKWVSVTELLKKKRSILTDR